MKSRVVSQEELCEITNSLWNNRRKTGKEFTILMPPPNVTGSLHIGHALTYFTQDVITRAQFIFNNKNAFMMIGFDHGGISTEISATKKLNLTHENNSKKLESIKLFAEDCKQKIKKQMNAFGLLINENYEKYTLDEDHYALICQTFKTLHDKGYIYRDLGLINFDTELKTAVSDLEVEYKEQKTKLYTLEYKIKNGTIKVATTRPETIFADVALCVNPEDMRYKKLIGSSAYIPIIDRKIPIIANEEVAIEFGTGVLKVTPAHDQKDYEIGLKNNLKFINILDQNGYMNFSALSRSEKHAVDILSLEGLYPQEARDIIVEVLKLESVEISQKAPFSSKSGARIETLLQNQWFFEIKSGAEEALKSDLKIFPDIWRNTYESWLKNVHRWCISRTILWGHKMPVWYNKQNSAEYHIGEQPADKENWIESTEVFDTWFSSALWPISYKETYNKYPTDVLVSAYDIIFFWIARMVIVSLMCGEKIPFKSVFFHRLVRDQEGKKMSKTLGNVLDPLDIIEKYGCDPLKLALLKTLSPLGQIRLSEEAIRDAQCIITKLWNACRYIHQFTSKETEEKKLNLVDEEIIHYFTYKLYKLELDYSKDLENYELHHLLDGVISFLYEVCDYLIEFHKNSKDLNNFLRFIMKKILLLVHPFISYTSTYLFYFLYEENIMNQEYTYEKSIVEQKLELINLIKKIRFFKKQNIKISIFTNKYDKFINKMCEVCDDKNHAYNFVFMENYKFCLENIDKEALKKDLLKKEQKLEILNKFFQNNNIEKIPSNVLNEKTQEKELLLKEINEEQKILCL